MADLTVGALRSLLQLDGRFADDEKVIVVATGTGGIEGTPLTDEFRSFEDALVFTPERPLEPKRQGSENG